MIRAAIIRELAAKVLAGATIRSLSQELNDRGETTVHGGFFRDRGVRNILISPRIAGLVPYGGEPVAEGTWEPIIPRELWERVCGALAVRPQGRKPRSFLLSGFVYCGRCGYRLHSHTGGVSPKGVMRRRCPPVGTHDKRRRPHRPITLV